MGKASIEDIIAMNSLYRPGPMDYIGDFIAGKKDASLIKYDCPELIPILEMTYGQIVYQEQVMQIFRDLAGYTWGGSDLVRRAMSKKHLDEIEAERQAFIYGDETRNIKGCIANGISEEAAGKIYDKMYAFASYAFNKSHAAAYSVTSYWTAWLKYYYPAYYMCSILNYAPNIDKLAEIIEDARSFGVEVLPPDINLSKEKFSVSNGKILFGLSNIKGVGAAAKIIIEEREKKPFSDIKDFLLRASERSSSTQALINAGAFDSLGYERGSISLNTIYMKDILELIDKIKKKTSFIENAYRVMSFVDEYTSVEDLKERIKNEEISYQITSKSVPSKDSINKRILSAKDVIKEAMDDLNEPYINSFDIGFEDEDTKLEHEKEVLGLYLTGHPIDNYDVSHKVDISDITEENKYISGIITELSIKKDRNGRDVARFSLEDKTGNIKCIVFNGVIADTKEELLREGQGVQLNVNISKDEFSSTDDEIVYQAKVNSIEALKRAEKEYELVVENEEDYLEKIKDIQDHESIEGNTLYILFKNHSDVSYIYPNKVNDSIRVIKAKRI